jgi:hypothetical protein
MYYLVIPEKAEIETAREEPCGKDRRASKLKIYPLS